MGHIQMGNVQSSLSDVLLSLGVEERGGGDVIKYCSYKYSLKGQKQDTHLGFTLS